MTTKAAVYVGYTSGGMDNYRYWKRKRLEGADITATDGQGNTIEVHVREAPYGYRVVVNGEEIATTFK
jgi:hypothetical protein